LEVHIVGGPDVNKYYDLSSEIIHLSAQDMETEKKARDSCEALKEEIRNHYKRLQLYHQKYDHWKRLRFEQDFNCSYALCAWVEENTVSCSSRERDVARQRRGLMEGHLEIVAKVQGGPVQGAQVQGGQVQTGMQVQNEMQISSELPAIPEMIDDKKYYRAGQMGRLVGQGGFGAVSEFMVTDAFLGENGDVKKLEDPCVFDPARSYDDSLIVKVLKATSEKAEAEMLKEAKFGLSVLGKGATQVAPVCAVTFCDESPAGARQCFPEKPEGTSLKRGVVMPNYKGGDLSKRLAGLKEVLPQTVGGGFAMFVARPGKPQTFVTAAQFQKTMLSIVKGVEYLHKQNIAHRDIKPANLLLKSRTLDAEDNVFVGDLGLAIDLNKLSDEQKTLLWSPKGYQAVGNKGTARYAAPEWHLVRALPVTKWWGKSTEEIVKDRNVVLGKLENLSTPEFGSAGFFAGDIWALGISAWELYFGASRWPFFEQLEKIQKNLQPEHANPRDLRDESEFQLALRLFQFTPENVPHTFKFDDVGGADIGVEVEAMRNLRRTVMEPGKVSFLQQKISNH